MGAKDERSWLRDRSGSAGEARWGRPARSDRGESVSDKPLYERLGGYDAPSAVADDLLPRLQGDSQLNATLDAFRVPQRERDDVVAFIESTRSDIVEA
jgi:hypothetical protein